MKVGQKRQQSGSHIFRIRLSENYKIMDLTHEKMVDIVLFWKYMVCMAYLMALGMFLII